MARSRRRSRSRKVGWANKLVIGRIAAIAGVVIAGTGGVFYQLGGWNGTSTGVNPPDGAVVQSDGITKGGSIADTSVPSQKPAFPDGSGLPDIFPGGGNPANQGTALAANLRSNPSGDLGSSHLTQTHSVQKQEANQSPSLPPTTPGGDSSTQLNVPNPLAKTEEKTDFGNAPLPGGSGSLSDLIASNVSDSGVGGSSQGSPQTGNTTLDSSNTGGIGSRLPVPSDTTQGSVASSTQQESSGGLGALGPAPSFESGSNSSNLGSGMGGSKVADAGNPPGLQVNPNSLSTERSPLPGQFDSGLPAVASSQGNTPNNGLSPSTLGAANLGSGSAGSNQNPIGSAPLPSPSEFPVAQESGNQNLGGSGLKQPDSSAIGGHRMAAAGSFPPAGTQGTERGIGSTGFGNEQNLRNMGTSGNGSGLPPNNGLPANNFNQTDTRVASDLQNQNLPGNAGGSSGLPNQSNFSGSDTGQYRTNQSAELAPLNQNFGGGDLARSGNGQSNSNPPIGGQERLRNDYPQDRLGNRNTNTGLSSVPNIQAASYQPPSGRGNGLGSTGASAPLTARATHPVASNRPGSPLQNTPQSASLVLSKKAPGQIQINVPTKFLLSVRNNGQAAASNVVVRDRIPEGTQLLRTNPKHSRINGDVLEWDFATIGARDEVQIEMELLPKQAGEIGSVAEVAFSAVAGCKTKCTRPILQITHTAAPEVLLGEQLVMNITVRNTGDGPAKNVLISELLPPAFSHPSLNGQNKRGIEAVIGTLMPNQSVTKQLAVRAQKVGRVTNTVRVSGDGKLSANHSIDIKVIAPNLQVRASGPNRRFIKRSATHTFQVANNGTAPASNLMFQVALPAGLKYQSSAPAGVYDARQHVVYWRMNQLVGGGEQKVTVSTLPLQSGNQPITFTALADRNQPQTVKKNLLVEQLSELFFDVDDTENVIEVGAATNYVVRVQNQGKQFDSNIKVRVAIPPGLKPLEVKAPVRYEVQRGRDGGALIVFEDIQRLNPGAQGKRIEIRTEGVSQGDHQVQVQVSSSRWPTPVSKQHTTKVYSDGTVQGIR